MIGGPACPPAVKAVGNFIRRSGGTFIFLGFLAFGAKLGGSGFLITFILGLVVAGFYQHNLDHPPKWYT